MKRTKLPKDPLTVPGPITVYCRKSKVAHYKKLLRRRRGLDITILPFPKTLKVDRVRVVPVVKPIKKKVKRAGRK